MSNHLTFGEVYKNRPNDLPFVIRLTDRFTVRDWFVVSDGSGYLISTNNESGFIPGNGTDLWTVESVEHFGNEHVPNGGAVRETAGNWLKFSLTTSPENTSECSCEWVRVLQEGCTCGAIRRYGT